jgi:hypothetical protein
MSGSAAAPATAASEERPLIDTHSRAVGAAPERVWDVVAHALLPRFGGPVGPLLARLLGCSQVARSPSERGVPETVVGFRVAEALRPSLVALEGEHRFSRYALTFRIEPSDTAATRLTAETRAAFPGLAGRLYRAGVIGSGGHAIVVHRLLSQIKHLAERD